MSKKTVALAFVFYTRYVQAANPPKNMVVLLDSSGSMMGLRIASAKLAVRAILSMLGDEDFFTVMAVNTTIYGHHIFTALKGDILLKNIRKTSLCLNQGFLN